MRAPFGSKGILADRYEPGKREGLPEGLVEHVLIFHHQGRGVLIVAS
jgi:hypothetical protein